MKTIDLSIATVRDLNQALHDQVNNVTDHEWVVTHSDGKHNLAVGVNEAGVHRYPGSRRLLLRRHESKGLDHRPRQRRCRLRRT